MLLFIYFLFLYFYLNQNSLENEYYFVGFQRLGQVIFKELFENVEKVSEYYQKIPQSHTADQPTEP